MPLAEYICCILQHIEDNLQKLGCHALENERKWIRPSVPEPSAYEFIHLSAFCPLVVHLPGVN